MRRDDLDIYGNLIWSMDERGFITKTAFDLATGAIVRRVDDVDTSLYTDVPTGWVTPSGGGKNLVSDFQNDPLGRTTEVLEPVYTAAVGSSSASARTARWTEYFDDAHLTLTAKGQVVGGVTATLVNPVSIAMTDASGRLL